MTAQLLREGAGSFDGHALQEALDSIGARLQTRAMEDETLIELDVLEQHVPLGVEMLGALLHEPLMREGDFERLRAERLQMLAGRATNPTSIADDGWRALIHGADNPRGGPAFGTPETIAAMQVGETRALWHDQSGPRGARILHAGCLEETALRDALVPLVDGWSNEGRNGRDPQSCPAPAPAAETRAWLHEVPGAKQCELRVGHRALAFTDPDHQPLAVWNHVFGGHFSSRINRRLREEMGVTYGARSSLGGGLRPGSWTAATAVRADAGGQAVLEILELFRRLLEDGVEEAELAFAKDSLGKADARRFETLDARLAYLDQWTRYDSGPNHPLERRARRESFTTATLDDVARRHLDPAKLEILVVGEVQETRKLLESAGVRCQGHFSAVQS
jgi:zinc protease